MSLFPSFFLFSSFFFFFSFGTFSVYGEYVVRSFFPDGVFFCLMSKNGSSRCFLAKNGCTLKTIAAESV